MRAVLDTSAVLSALVFPRGRLAWLVETWSSGRVRPLGSRATIAELVRALAYPKFGLDPDEIETLLGLYLPFVEIVAPGTGWPHGIPRCRDARDDAFLLLAARGSADLLVTSDRDLLALAGRTPFPIESPAAFRRRLA